MNERSEPDSRAFRKATRAHQSARAKAKALRAVMTPPEVMLWNHLRGKRLADLRFRRQHPLGAYIADFYCHDARLVIEIDGASHAGVRRDRDATRDTWMIDRGLRVLRIPAVDVLQNMDDVLRTIHRAARDRIDGPPPSPSATPPPPGRGRIKKT